MVIKTRTLEIEERVFPAFVFIFSFFAVFFRFPCFSFLFFLYFCKRKLNNSKLRKRGKPAVKRAESPKAHSPGHRPGYMDVAKFAL